MLDAPFLTQKNGSGLAAGTIFFAGYIITTHQGQMPLRIYLL